MTSRIHDPEKQDCRTAHDVKVAHQILRDFPDDALKQIPILPEGARLEPGATYLDLRDPARSPFRATADMTAGPANYYVPKTEVDYHLWNRLIGVEIPQRTCGQI